MTNPTVYDDPPAQSHTRQPKIVHPALALFNLFFLSCERSLTLECAALCTPTRSPPPSTLHPTRRGKAASGRGMS